MEEKLRCGSKLQHRLEMNRKSLSERETDRAGQNSLKQQPGNSNSVMIVKASVCAHLQRVPERNRQQLQRQREGMTFLVCRDSREKLEGNSASAWQRDSKHVFSIVWAEKSAFGKVCKSVRGR